MKITGKKVGEFYNALKNQNCTYKLCLLFGQDESVISSKSRDILNIFKDKNIVNISSDEIKNNPHSAYNVDKKDCKVKTLTKKVDVIKNSKIVSLNPNNR